MSLTTQETTSHILEPHSVPLGRSLPPEDQHAVSVSLPTWNDIVSYMASDRSIHDKLQCDYPRFYQHASVVRLNEAVLTRIKASKGLHCAIFPSEGGMKRFSQYLLQKESDSSNGSLSVQEAFFQLSQLPAISAANAKWARFWVVIYPELLLGRAFEGWGWLGDGMSSRHADFCFDRFRFMESIQLSQYDPCTPMPSLQTNATSYRMDATLLRVPWAHDDAETKGEIKSLIAKWSTSQQPEQAPVVPSNVFLYPKGMCAIGDIARLLVPKASHSSEAVVHGWPYGSTPKCCQISGYERFTFHSQGSSEELDQLESRLAKGGRIACLICEVPSNPLCATPDLSRIRDLADRYDFKVICDETIGTFINVDVLPYVDIIITSLTKMFSGYANVMGGSVILNSGSRYFAELHSKLAGTHEDLIFPLDADTLLCNCLDFPDRVQKANITAEALATYFSSQPSSLISRVNYPNMVPTTSSYEQYRRQPHGGYGSLISIVFQNPDAALRFYDAVDLCKGPSFGANFTLVLPYSQLAHAFELDWAESQGMPKHIIRVSVGLENKEILIKRFEEALRIAEEEFSS